MYFLAHFFTVMEFPVWEMRSFGLGLYPALIHPLRCSNTTLPTHLVPTGEELWANHVLYNILLVTCLVLTTFTGYLVIWLLTNFNYASAAATGHRVMVLRGIMASFSSCCPETHFE